MDLGIAGKVAFVSGGSMGMGRTTAELFASEGCRVVVAALPEHKESIDDTVAAIQTAGGQEAFDAAVRSMLDDARGWRLAELRKRRGMTQEQVAARMGVSVARVSQIERGDVSTQDVLNRFVTALGGTLKLIADFGDEQLKIA